MSRSLNEVTFRNDLGANCHFNQFSRPVPVFVVTDLDGNILANNGTINSTLEFTVPDGNLPTSTEDKTVDKIKRASIEVSTSSRQYINNWVVTGVKSMVTRFFSCSNITIVLSCHLPDESQITPQIPNELKVERDICVWSGFIESMRPVSTDDLKNNYLMRVFVGIIDKNIYTATGTGGYTLVISARDRIKWLMDTSNTYDIGSITGTTVYRSDLITGIAQKGIGYIDYSNTNIKETPLRDNKQRIIKRDFGGKYSFDLDKENLKLSLFTLKDEEFLQKYDFEKAYLSNISDSKLSGPLAGRVTTPLKVDIDPTFIVYTSRVGVSTQNTAQVMIKQQHPIDMLKTLAMQEIYPTEVFQSHIDGNFYYYPRSCDYNSLNDPKRYFRTYFFKNVPSLRQKELTNNLETFVFDYPNFKYEVSPDTGNLTVFNKSEVTLTSEEAAKEKSNYVLDPKEAETQKKLVTDSRNSIKSETQIITKQTHVILSLPTNAYTDEYKTTVRITISVNPNSKDSKQLAVGTYETEKEKAGHPIIDVITNNKDNVDPFPYVKIPVVDISKALSNNKVTKIYNTAFKLEALDSRRPTVINYGHFIFAESLYTPPTTKTVETKSSLLPPDPNQMMVSLRHEYSSIGVFTNYILYKSNNQSDQITTEWTMHLELLPEAFYDYSQGQSLAESKRIPIANKYVRIEDPNIKSPAEGAAVLLNVARVYSRATQSISMIINGDPSLSPGELVQIFGTPIIYNEGLNQLIADRNTYMSMKTKATTNFINLARQTLVSNKEDRQATTPEETIDPRVLTPPGEVNNLTLDQFNNLTDQQKAQYTTAELYNGEKIILTINPGRLDNKELTSDAILANKSNKLFREGVIKEPATILRVEAVMHKFNISGQKGFLTEVALTSPF